MKIEKIKREYLFALFVIGIIVVAFSAIQIVNALPGTATTGSKPNPGHSWNEIANFSCPTGECLQNNSGGTLICAACSGGGGYWTQFGTALFPSQTTWNVGIGTTNPQAKLDVVGAIKTSTFLDLTGATTGIKDYYGSSGTSGQILYRQTNGLVWGNARPLNCTRVSSTTSGNGWSWLTVSATCSAGYKATGGGIESEGGGITDIYYSRPNSTISGWECRAYAAFEGSWTLRCYAVCCNI